MGACMCEHQNHDAQGGCAVPARRRIVFDRTPVPLCPACIDAAHMGKPDDDQRAMEGG